MNERPIHSILLYFSAIVWAVNGLLCKVLNLVPRHEQIVARILGNEYSRLFTLVIGLSEIGMAIWISARIQTTVNAWTQIFIVVIMNMLEFIMAPDLLLWGKLNSIFAILFSALIYINEFHFNRPLTPQH